MGRFISNCFPRWLWSLQIAKKNKGKAKDVIDFPSYNYAQAARSHVKMFIIKSHGLDISSPLICPDWAKWWISYQASTNVCACLEN